MKETNEKKDITLNQTKPQKNKKTKITNKKGIFKK